MKKLTKLLLVSLSTCGFVSPHAMDEFEKTPQNMHIQTLSHLNRELLEQIFFHTFLSIKKNQDNPDTYIKSIENQRMKIALVCHPYYQAIFNSQYYPLNIINKSWEKITPKKYFIINQSRMIAPEELNCLFGLSGFNVLSFINLNLPTSGLSENQLTCIKDSPLLTGILTVNNEFQETLKKSTINLPPHIKVTTYQETAKKNIIVQPYASYTLSSLCNQLDKEQPELRDRVLNLLGQIKKIKIDEETIKNLIIFHQTGKDYLIDIINRLADSSLTARDVRAFCDIHPLELNGFIEQLLELKAIPLTLQKKIDCLKVVHPTQRPVFARRVASIKGPVHDYEPIMRQLKGLPITDGNAFIDDLNRIAKMYYFIQTHDYKQIQKIDEKLIDSLKKVSSYTRRAVNFCHTRDQLSHRRKI